MTVQVQRLSVMSTDTEQRASRVFISDWAQMTMTSRFDHGELIRVLPTVRIIALGCHVTLTARSFHGELSKVLPAVLGCHVTLTARSFHGELSKVLPAVLGFQVILTARSIFGELIKVLLPVRSLSRGSHVTLTHCVDVNLVMHCDTMERHVPDWFVIPVHDKPYMFGDKKSVTSRSMRVHVKKHTHCNMMAHWRDKLLEWEQLKSVFFW